MNADVLELWGFCDPCSRWFFVPRRPDGERPRPHEHRITCPVCVMPAGRFEGRGPGGVEQGVESGLVDAGGVPQQERL